MKSALRSITSINPFTREVLKTYPFISNKELQQKLVRGQSAYKVHSNRTLNERAALIANLGNIIQKHASQISRLITTEIGKPIIQSEGEVKKTVAFCRYYSTNYDPILPQMVRSDAKKSTWVKYLPLGTIYSIIPFNFPFYLNFKSGLPNLLLGNTLLARNSDSTPQLGELVQKLAHEAGYTNGEYQNVYTSHDQLQQVLKHDSVIGVTFTGSSAAGGRIAGTAGKYLKRSVMELGGNDPFVVLRDANMKLVLQAALRGRCANAGQVCFSPKRFIIAKEVYEKFKTNLIEGLQAVKFGDPMDRTTEMGPLAREDLLTNLDYQLKHMPSSYQVVYSRKEMQIPFFPLTVVEGSNEVFDQEMFGPVFMLYKAEDQEHAIQLANSGTYGLAASVFSAERGEIVVDRIRSGMAFVNDVPKSDVTYPTGGVGRSGFGRESGVEGYRSFANIKTHYVS